MVGIWILNSSIQSNAEILYSSIQSNADNRTHLKKQSHFEMLAMVILKITWRAA
jgi:hypothetical protein